jgi:hypothetical protein
MQRMTRKVDVDVGGYYDYISASFPESKECSVSAD